MNKKEDELKMEMQRKMIEKPETIFNLLEGFKNVAGDDFIKEMIRENLDFNKKIKEKERIAEMIKIPKILLDTEVVELINLREVINEFNTCYFNYLWISLALLSRKIIIDVTHALPYQNTNNSVIIEEIDNLKGKSFDKYIDWLFANNYLTTKNEILLRKMKAESNWVHHGRVGIEETKKDAYAYFETIKLFIEGNFDTIGISFAEKSTLNK